jgi:predicted trehalose synthase
MHTDEDPSDAYVLGVMEDFLPAAEDGWELGVRSALACVTGETRALPGAGTFTGEARELGAAWTLRTRRAFCAGYAAAGGADPACHPVALRAFEADKAVYEAVYEAHHRPGRLPIPLAALQRLVAPR